MKLPVSATITALPSTSGFYPYNENAQIDSTTVQAYLRAADKVAAIFNSGAADGAARQAQLTVEAALVLAAFLYRSEIGTNAATATAKVQLTPFELASAVSFAVLNSSPDTELWSKATDGTLSTPAVLPAQVARLMAVPRAQANFLKKVEGPRYFP